MSSGRLLLMESNTTGTGPAFGRAARAMGAEPVFLVSDRSRYDFLDGREFASLVVDTSDESAVRRACGDLATRERLVGVTSSSEYFIAAAARAARYFGLPAPDPSAVEVCQNKELQRETLTHAGLLQPAYGAVSSVDEAEAVAESLGYPVVLKPVTGSGKVGVRLARSTEELRQSTNALLARRMNERSLPIPRRVLVEAYLEGPEFSCETFDGAVVGVTKKHVGSLPFFVETGHDFPAPISPEEAGQVGQVAIAATAALRLQWGAAHTEVRVTQDGPRLIEVNPRLAGGHIPSLVLESLGVDLVAAQVARACGLSVDLTPKGGGSASIRFVVPPTAGTLASVQGVTEAQAMPGVIAVALYRSMGDRVHLRGDFRDRIGHVLAGGPDSHEAACRAEAAVKMVNPVFWLTQPEGRV